MVSKYNIEGTALPYPETETDYQDQTDNLNPGSVSIPPRTDNTPTSYISFGSKRSSTLSTSSSLTSKGSSHSRKNDADNEKTTAVEATTMEPMFCEKQAQHSNDRCGMQEDEDDSKDLDSLNYEYETATRPTMEIKQMNMTNPQERSVQISVEAAIIGIPSLFAAKVEFQEPVQVFWIRRGDEVPGSMRQPRVGQMSLGTIEKRAFAKAEFTQETTFEIADPILFGEFAKVMMAAENFLWRVTAKINVSVIGRTIKDLSLDKSIALNGLSNFANLKILTFDIPSDAPNGAGALVSIKVSIPNPSPVGMSLGTLEIDMNLKTAYLGRITAKNVLLIGGQPTILTLEGVIQRQTDSIALQELSTMITNYLANNPTTAYGQGVSVLPDGIRPVSWITTAIVSTKMTIPLLPPTPMNVVKKIDIRDLDLSMTPQQPWTPTVASSGIAAAIQLPFNLSLSITEIWDPVLTLGYEQVPIGDITAAVWNKSNSDMTRNYISFSLPTSPMAIRQDSHDAFGRFLVAMAQQESATVDILGSSKSVATTSLGPVNITVPFNTSLVLKGVNFGAMKPELSGIVVASATVDYVVLNATVNLHNPSIFNINAGPATLHIIASVKGMTDNIGEVLIPNLRLAPGPNPVQAFVHFRPTNPAFRDAFFTEYIIGTNFDASIYGDANSSPIVSLAPIMESLKLSTTVPGMNPAPKLIVGGSGNTSVGQFLNNHQIMLQVQIMNPLPTQLWMHELSANVSWGGFPFGAINVVQSFPIKPSGIDTSPLFGVQIPSNYDFWIFMVTTFLPQNLGVLTGATVVVDLTAEILATVDGPLGSGYQARIRYAQDQVGVFLKIEFSLAGLGLGFGRRRKRSDLQLDGEEHGLWDDEGESVLGLEPDKSDSVAYLAWLKRAVQLSFPEEAARDTQSQ
ncbi:hypothetical protein BGZ50_008637 [Haplosporangium sp. Z 11]|nr:hypothetical protein BGZ50_008637 [Haplosporangium sp. Z 11]